MPAVAESVKVKLREQFVAMDPVHLLQQIRAAQQVLSNHARAAQDEPRPSQAFTDVAVFMSSLATAWESGEVRPTHRKKATAARWWRSRPDPFAHVWPVVEQWLETEPTATAKEMMQRLAAMVPDAYTGQAQLRTLQRRVKQWREQKAKDLIMGHLRRLGELREGAAAATSSLSVPVETTI